MPSLLLAPSEGGRSNAASNLEIKAGDNRADANTNVKRCKTVVVAFRGNGGGNAGTAWDRVLLGGHRIRDRDSARRSSTHLGPSNVVDRVYPSGTHLRRRGLADGPSLHVRTCAPVAPRVAVKTSPLRPAACCGLTDCAGRERPTIENGLNDTAPLSKKGLLQGKQFFVKLWPVGIGIPAMHKLLSVCYAVLLGTGVGVTLLPTASQAVTVGYGDYLLTQSDAFGTGSFGHVVVSNIGGTTAQVSVQVNPNFLLDTGSHYAFTLSLNGGSIDTTSFNSTHFSLVSGGGPFSNSPFGTFTSAIAADCTRGNCGPTLGSSLIFNILNFGGLNTATSLYNSLAIVFAADIYKGGCTGDGCTGVVGAPLNPVPLPGALLLFGSGLAGLGLLSRRRRERAKLHHA